MVRATTWPWHWRRSPLRRRSDVVEAWLGVVAVLVTLLAGPAVGWGAGSLAHEALRQTVREQHRHRHPVSAIAVRSVPDGRSTETGHGAAADREGYHRIVAHWRGPDGTARSGTVSVPRATGPGDRFPLWTDDRGRVSTRPMDPRTAAVHAVLAGFGAALATGGLVETARRLAVWRLVQRRYAQWDRAWERAGHTWGRADAGS